MKQEQAVPAGEMPGVRRVEPARRPKTPSGGTMQIGGIPCEVTYRGPDFTSAGVVPVSVVSDGNGLWGPGGSDPTRALARREQHWADSRLAEIGRANASDAGNAEQGGGDLQKMHRLLRGRYAWAIVLALLLGGAGGYAGMKLGRRTYQSVGLVNIVPVHVITQSDSQFNEQFVDAQAAMMRSQHVMDLALDDHLWQNARGTRSDEVEADFAKELDVTRQGSLLVVKFTDPDPQAAQLAVQTTLQAFEKLFNEDQAANGGFAQNRLTQTRSALSQKLASITVEINAKADPYGPDGLQAERTFKIQQLQDIDRALDQLTRTQVEIASAATTQPGVAKSVDELAVTDAVLAQLIQRKHDLVNQIAAMQAAGFLEKNQGLIKLRSQLQVTDDDIQDRAELVRTIPLREDANGTLGLRSKLPVKDAIAFLNSRKTKLQSELTGLSASIADIEGKRIEAARIQNDLNVVEETLHHWDVEQTRYRLEITRAERPLTPYRDTRVSFASAGGLGGVILGFGLIMLLGLADRRIRTPADAKGNLGGRPMLGVLPHLPEDLSDPEKAAAAAHGVHEIRTLLQIWGRGRNHQVFGITSAAPGSGKTSLTAALGLSFAAAGFKTLLIDCDLIGGGLTSRIDAMLRPKIGQILLRRGLITDEQLRYALKHARASTRPLGEILLEQQYVTEADLTAAIAAQSQESVGLLDAMAGDDLADCVVETGVSGLWVLPLGGATAQHAGTLSPEVLNRVINTARESFDVVLIDTGPVPGSLEASVTASQVDAIVLTIARGDRRPAVERSLAHLQSLGARIAGIVFNRARERDIDTSTSSRISSAGSRPLDPDETLTHSQVGHSSRLGPVARAVASHGPRNGNGSFASR